MHSLSRKNLSFRLLSAFIAVIVIVLLSISLFSIFREERKARMELVRKGETLVNLLSYSSRIGIFAENRDQLRDVAAGFAAERDVLLVGIYNADRKPVYVSDPAFPGSGHFPENSGSAGAAGAIQEAPDPRAEGRTLEFSRPVVLTVLPNEVPSLYFAESGAGAKEQVIGYVKIVLDQEALNHEILKVVMQNTIIALIFIFAGIVVMYLWVRKITKPLETLTREVKALGEGSDVSNIPVQTVDEIGRLTKAFNTMLDERKIAEQARKNILRDLHDGIGGIMTNIIMLSELSQMRSIPEEVTSKLATISALSREGIEEIRSLIYSLDLHNLSWPLLIAEMKSQGYKLLEPHAIAFEMTTEVEKGVGEPGSLLCLHLFRIYREALTNVVKHSKAMKVMVVIHIKKDRLDLSVRDDGVGCKATAFLGKGRGVANILSRAEEIGGFATITTDNGTCLFMEIPLSIRCKPA